jgi:hypothetical protein
MAARWKPTCNSSRQEPFFDEMGAHPVGIEAMKPYLLQTGQTEEQ